MEIRLATPEDADALFDMNEQFNGAGSNTREQIDHSLRENRLERVWVAQIAGKIAGFCCTQIFASMCYREGYAEITELFVEPAYRRCGVASALLAQAEAFYRTEGIHALQLFTGHDNTTAQALYEKAGYCRSEEWMYRKRK
ncbi:MAG: GNAT family N-acetyltransferase [Clostridia bacterium]